MTVPPARTEGEPRALAPDRPLVLTCPDCVMPIHLHPDPDSFDDLLRLVFAALRLHARVGCPRACRCG